MGIKTYNRRAGSSGGCSGAMGEAGDQTKVSSVGECNRSILDDDWIGENSGGSFRRIKKGLCASNALEHIRLSKAERDDLSFSLGLLGQEVHEITMTGEHDKALGTFGMWADRQI